MRSLTVFALSMFVSAVGFAKCSDENVTTLVKLLHVAYTSAIDINNQNTGLVLAELKNKKPEMTRYVASFMKEQPKQSTLINTNHTNLVSFMNKNPDCNIDNFLTK